MKKLFTFINIENKLSVQEIAEALNRERVKGVMECLTIIKKNFATPDDFRFYQPVVEISNLYSIDLRMIR